MATVLDSLKVILGIDSKNYTEGMKKAKQDLKDLKKEVTESPKVLKKAEDEKQKIREKAYSGDKKRRSKAIKETNDERIKEIQDEKKAEDEKTKNVNKSENDKTNAFVSAISKRFAVAYLAKKTWDIAKEGVISAADFHRLASSMADSDVDMKAFSNRMQLIGGDAGEAKEAIISLQDRLSAFQLYGEGAEELSRQLSYIGIGLRKSNGEMKTSLDLMTDIEDYVNRNPKRLNQAMLYSTVSQFISRDQMYAMLGGKKKDLAKEYADTSQPKAYLAQEDVELQSKLALKANSKITSGTEEVTGFFDYAKKSVSNFIDNKYGNVPPKLAKTIVATESGGNPNAISPKGAEGAWQVMPRTFAEYAKKLGIENPNPFNPKHSEAVGSSYLSDLAKQKGGFGQGVSSYNMGPNYTGGHFEQGTYVGNLPRQTEDYLGHILQKLGGGYSYDSKSGNVTNINGVTMNIHGEGLEAQDVANKVMQEINRLSVDTGGNNMGMR